MSLDVNIRLQDKLERSTIFNHSLRAFLLSLLIVLGLYNLNLFHLTGSLIPVIISMSLFLLTWNTRNFINNPYITFMGMSCFFIGLFSLGHIVFYHGANLIVPIDATRLVRVTGLFADIIQGFSFLLAPLFFVARVKFRILFIIISVFLLSMLYFSISIDPVFKYYIVFNFTSIQIFMVQAVLLICALFLTFRIREAFDKKTFYYLLASMVCCLISGISYVLNDPFTTYHAIITIVFNILTLLFLYDAIITTVLLNPYSSLAQSLITSKKLINNLDSMYTNLFENINAGVAIFRPEHGNFTLISINRTALELDDLDIREVLGRKVTEIWPSVKEYGIYEAFEHVRDTGDSVEWPTSLYEDERIRAWRESFIYQLESGLLVSVYTDRTDEKEQEEKLLESERRYRTVAEFTYDLEYWVAPDGSFLYISPACERITGYTVEEFMNDPELMDSIIYPEDRFKSCSMNSKDDGTLNVNSTEFRIKTKNHLTKWIGHICMNIYDEDGTYLGIRGSSRDITGKKEAELEVLRSKALFETLFDALSIPIFRKDLEGHYVMFNKAFCNFFERDKEELQGISVYDLHTKEVADICMNRDKALLLSGDSIQSYTIGVRTKNGLRQVIIRKSLLKDHDDVIIGFVGGVFDITKLNQLQNQLMSEKLLHEEAQRVAKLGHWEFVNGDKFPNWSDQVFEIFGVSKTAKGLSIEDWKTIIDPRDYDMVIDAFNTCRLENRSFEIEFRAIKFDTKEPRWLYTIGRCVEDTEPKRVYGIVQDITDYKEAQISLHSTEFKFKTLIDNLNVGIYSCTVGEKDTKFIEVNDALVRLLGAKNKQQLYKLRPKDFWLNPEKRDLLSFRLLKYGKIRNMELQLRTLDGSKITGLVSGVVVHDDESKPIRTDMILEDITQRRNLEIQLQHAVKMEAVGRFASKLSHDFNNLLSILQGYSEILKKELPEGQNRQRAELIHKSSINAQKLISRLLKFSRKEVLEVHNVNIQKFLDVFYTSVKGFLSENIQLKFISEIENTYCNMDIAQMEQVLMNIIVNAKDAMPDGGSLLIECISINVDDEFTSSKPHLNSGGYVCIKIGDTGHGMSDETRLNIFEPFFTTKAKGTGLGLSTAYGIIKQHGGDIWVYSELGKGTTFKIYLPIVSKDSYAPKVDEKIQILDTSLHGDENLIIVEDDRALLTMFTDILSSSGYYTMPFTDGDQCLEAMVLTDVIPDLVVSDYVMPGGYNGQQLCEELLELYPDIRIILMSGYSEKLNGSTRVSGKIKAYLEKPFSNRELLQLVRTLLDERRRSIDEK